MDNIDIENITYQDDECTLEAFVAVPSKQKRPLVILCHARRGKDNFICEKAKEIAQLGYVGFALDIYGKGVIGNSKEENALLKKPFIEDRQLLQRRVVKAFDVACSLPCVDTNQVSVLGFGFGGICALDLARSGVNLKGAISLYGHFDSPPGRLVQAIKAKVLILHGFNDPIVTQEELHRFEIELNAQNVDWQTHIYGETMHAFATPEANDPASGILYNPIAAVRAWNMVHLFLQEAFSS